MLSTCSLEVMVRFWAWDQPQLLAQTSCLKCALNCEVFSIKCLPLLLQTLSLFSVPLYPISSSLSIGVLKHGRTNRLLGKGCVLQRARNLHTAVSHAGKIREYYVKDTGSEVQYRWGEKQRMLIEDDLQVNPKKQYRYNLNLHTAKVIELIF